MGDRKTAVVAQMRFVERHPPQEERGSRNDNDNTKPMTYDNGKIKAFLIGDQQ